MVPKPMTVNLERKRQRASHLDIGRETPGFSFSFSQQLLLERGTLIQGTLGVIWINAPHLHGLGTKRQNAHPS